VDPAVAAKIVESLDAELAPRRSKKIRALVAQWREEADGSILYVLRQAVDWQNANGPLPEGWYCPPVTDEAELWRLEEWIVGEGGPDAIDDMIWEKIDLLQRRDVDMAAGIRRQPYKPPMVRGMGPKVGAAGKPDPAAPTVVERTGRRGATPLVVPGSPEDGSFWAKGMVLTFNPRTHEGAVRARDGKEYRLAPRCLMDSGLVTLVPGMRAEFKIIANECDLIKAAWH
jgi:hypothetical protein